MLQYTMKRTCLTALLIITAAVSYAQKYMTRTGKIFFSADAPGNPEVEATNNEVAAVADAGSGGIVFQVPVKSFKFKKELMQTHFNENYMQSDKFPHAEFKGKINDLSSANFSKDGDYKAKVSGSLTIHGVTRQVSVPGSIVVKGSNVTLKANFSVPVKDYDITIPGVVADKIAKVAQIDVDCALTKQ